MERKQIGRVLGAIYVASTAYKAASDPDALRRSRAHWRLFLVCLTVVVLPFLVR